MVHKSISSRNACLRKSAGVLIVLCSWAVVTAAQQQQQQQQQHIVLHVFSREVGTLPYGVGPQEVHVSPDGDRFGFVGQLRDKVVAVIDGVQQRKYDWIVEGQIGFTADSEHSFYTVRRGSKRVFVFDEIEGKPYDSIHPPVASATGGRAGYVAGRGGTYFTVIGGTEGRAYDGLALAALSEHGKSACIATVGNEQCAVIDGAEGNRYERVADVRMSDDGAIVAYRARRGDQWLMVVNGAEQRPFDEVGPAAVAGRGPHYAYAARSGNATFLVHNGEERQLTTRSLPAHVTLSPDGKRVAYAAVVPGGNGVTVVNDDRNLERFDQVLGMRFSPDGNRLAVVARRGGKSVLVADGVDILAAENIHPHSVGFSDDGRFIACVARIGEEDTVFVNGVRGPSFGQVLNRGPLTFQPGRTMFPIVAANFREAVSPLGSPTRIIELVHADVTVIVR